MVETSWFEGVDNKIIDKPGKYTLKGDYAQALLDKYYSYLDLAKDSPEEFKDFEAAANRAIASFRKSMEKPSTATKEKAPSKNKKDNEREIRARVFEATREAEFLFDRYGSEFDTLPEAQLVERAKELYKEEVKNYAEMYAKLPESAKDSPSGLRYKKILAMSENDAVQRDLAIAFEYKAAKNELASFLKEPLPYPEAVEPEIDSNSLEVRKSPQPEKDETSTELNSLSNLGIDFQSATMDASGTRLPTPGAFTGKFQEILEGADSWSEVADRLQGQTITYFDFETTGISDYDGQDVFNDPVQLGAVQVKDGKIVKRFNMYVNPESRLSDWSANNLKRDVLDENGDIVRDENGKPTTTLVTPEWLAQQPSQKEALDAFIEFIGPDALLGGQNVPFDVEILKRMADKYNTPLSIAGTIDSKDLASLLPKYDPEKGVDGPKAPDRKTGEVRASSSLGPVANFLGFEPANWHSADGDAEDSYNLVSKIIDRAAEENNSNLSLLDFDAMQERYKERMAEFKQVVSGDNPITEAQEKALSSMAESTNPEVAKLAREALANKSTRGAAAEVLSRLHELENNTPAGVDASASSSSGKKYDLSGIQWSTKVEDVIKKPEPAQSNPDDVRSWPELESFLTEFFRYFPTPAQRPRRLGSDSLTKIKEARKKYNLMAKEGDPEKIDDAKKRYISAIQDVMDIHLEEFDENQLGKYSGKKYQALGYKPDGILNNKDVALLLSKYRMAENDPNNRGKQPVEVKSAADANKEREERILREVPEISPSLLSSLEGSWTIADKRRLLGTFNLKLNEAKSRLVGWYADIASLSDAEMNFVTEDAKRAFYDRLSRRENLAAFRDIVDDRGNVIRVYRNPRGKGVTATDAQIKIASSAFRKIRDRIGSDKKPVTLSFTALSSILPSLGRAEKTESRTLGFAFKGGDAHVIASRNEKGGLQTGEYDPNRSHHSNNYSTYEEKLEHTIIHEYGHVMMYKYWADNDNTLDNGAIALKRDYEKYGVKGQVVSDYGKESVSEHFAEAFARYIVTGDATPEFLNLLRSKGLLKSQQEN